MKTRKATRKKTGSTRRTAKAAATKRKTVKAKTSRPRPVALPADCVVAAAADLRTALLKRLSDAGNVQIDARAVQRVDTASLQVLAAFTRDRLADGLAVEWLEVPACVTDAAKLLDLTTALGLGVQA